MFSFFKKKTANQAESVEQPATTAEYAKAPGTEISYSPELVDSLKSEHAALLTLYGEIKTAFESGDYETVSARLARFRGLLQGHLLTENVRLYIYLDRQFAHDDTNAQLIRGFRREMDSIGRTAMNFLQKYEAIGVDPELAGAFKRDFEQVGQVLVERIEREEGTLYPLYLPNY